jgi:exodeoxyribonuclease V beta subunit
MSEPRPFDVCGPLPGKGVTVLEASAGTGKTFTVAALASRYVAAGTPVTRILIITFTRLATSELRDRVRQRLAGDEQALGRFLDARPPGGDSGNGRSPAPAFDHDDIVATLAAGPVEEVARRGQRLADALAAFDAACITTTHGFCHLALSELGVSGPVPTGAVLSDDPDALVDDTVNDVYARRVLRTGEPPFGLAEARAIAAATIANPGVDLVPDPDDSPAGRRRRFADHVRHKVGQRLRDANLLTFDDLLVQLSTAMEDPVTGAGVCERLKGDFDVVLVDEFQDTDPVQWRILQRAFGGGDRTLVLVGDPKQAIYAFRGADVYAYLRAAAAADHRFSLARNWRSDKALIDATDALLQPLQLGHPGIVYRPVEPGPAHLAPGLTGAPVPDPLRLRVVDASRARLRGGNRGPHREDAEKWVARDLAAQVVELLSSPARRRTAWGWSPVRPGAIAVLVRTNDQASTVRAALEAVDVPATEAGTQSVFLSAAAGHWITLLEALEQPSSGPRVAAVALTPWVNMPAAHVAEADDATWDTLTAQLHRWADVLRRHGVATLARTVLADRRLPGSLLAVTDGERRLTDMGHIAQLLHAESAGRQREPATLRGWLARRVEEAAGDQSEERSRRLDSDADAIQILTVHRAKGLEFPVVFCPFAWQPSVAPRRGQPVVFHDPAAGGVRTLDVGGVDGNPGVDQHLRWARAEQRGEDLRNLYVALTRARHQVVLWWVATPDARDGPIARLLMARGPDGSVAPDGKGVVKEAAVVRQLQGLAGAGSGGISVEPCGDRDPRWDRRWTRPATLGNALDVARFSRELDVAWQRTSYTAIVAGAHRPAVGSEPEDAGLADEPGAPEPGAAGAAEPVTGVRPALAALLQVASPLAEMPGGAGVGIVIHRVLEKLDFQAADLPTALEEALAGPRSAGSVDLGPPGHAEAGLAEVLTTPLGPLIGDACLRDFAGADRLDEMGFELPLVGGDHPAGEVTAADVGRLLAAHLPAEGMLAGYPARLADPGVAWRWRGYLNGSLDLVLRQKTGAGPPRYFVVDYKTNRLAPAGDPLTAWHYRSEALDAEMQRAHYPLQAILYLVALHRYLRWRVPGYSPGTHLGGVLYLFLRGMTGPANPVVDGHPCGVFGWAPPAALVTGLSTLLDRGRRR